MNRLYLDIETNTTHDRIWCVCCKASDNSNWVIPAVSNKQYLQDLIDEHDEVVAHNGIGFDFPVLKKVWGITVPPEKQRDTLVLSRLVNPQMQGGHSLKNWGLRLKVEKMDFDVEDFDAGLTEEMIEYCQRDVEVLKKVDLELDKTLNKWKDAKQSVALEHEVARIMHQQELNGFKLDVPYATTLLGELRTRMGQIESELQEVFPPIVTERYSEKTGKRLKDGVEVFNVGSRQQIYKRLSSLGAKFTEKTEKGTPIVNEPVLEGIDLPEAKLCLEYLTIQKRVGMLDSWLDKVCEDDRVRGKVITNGAVTGRMTHHSPNMGQITSVNSIYGAESRKCWTVEQGNVLVGCDLSGIELRCLAHYMQDEEWTRELLEGDIHTKNQLAAGLETRAQAKTMIYATLYGAGAAKIGSIVGGGRNRGKEIMDNFYRNTPALAELKEKVGRIYDKTGGFLPGLDGRALIVRQEHSALNTLLQGAGAVIAKQWLVECHKELDRTGLSQYVKQVAFVHDEKQAEVPEKYAKQVAEVFEKSAKRAGEVLGFRVPVEAESKIGSNWYETH